MAIVPEYSRKSRYGVTVYVDDRCCTNLTPEEVARRYQRIDQQILRINMLVQHNSRNDDDRAAD